MISLNLIRSFIPWILTNEEIVDGFTALGVEIENIFNRHSIDGATIGIIREISPATEKLKLTKTEVESGELVEIITNSKTVKVGDKIIAVLPGGLIGSRDVVDKSIQGFLSQGVFASSKDCGINTDLLPADEREGVWILPKDSPEFTDPNESLWLKDTLLEESITPNHPEWQGLEGLIRELALVQWWKTGLAPDVPRFNTVNIKLEGITEDQIGINIDNEEECPRYTGVIANIDNVEPSGFKMRKLLLASNIRPVNNVVDATNLAMYFTNQPTHAFDLRKIKSGTIRVSNTKKPMKFKTLDDVEHDLPEGTLMICDGDEPVGIAGIMGGKDSEIDNNTRRIFLESASFSNETIAKTVSLTGIRTDASTRFDKGADIETTERTALMVMDFLGIPCAKPLSVGGMFKRPKLILRSSRMKQILGYLPDLNRVKTGFSILGIKCDGEDDISVEIPGYRSVDLSSEIDLIEEAVRVTGYDKVPATLPKIKLSIMNEEPEFAFEQRLKRISAGLGFNECKTLTFSSDQELKTLLLDSFIETSPNISNPMSSDSTMMRPLAELGLISVAVRNLKQGNANLELFEISSQFGPEKRRLALLTTGSLNDFWNSRARVTDFFDIKGRLVEIFRHLNVRDIDLKESSHAHLHPYRQADVFYRNNYLGYIGEIHPEASNRLDISSRFKLANIDIESLRKVTPSVIKAKAVPKYPSVLRDISLIAPLSSDCESIKQVIIDSCNERLLEVRLFDLFTPDKLIEKGKKSLAFSLMFNDPEGTLTGSEIDSQIEVSSTNLEKFGVELRMG
jgi:phenylalanyl-tRNA synthetase beta chain